MILGLSSYTYGWAIGVPGHPPDGPMDEQQLLDCTLQHGLKLLQVCDNLPLWQLSPGRLERFAQRAAQEGVRLEVGSRRLTTSHVDELLDLARRVGAGLVRFVIDGPDFHPTPAEVVQTLREVAPRLNGLKLGLENHDRLPAATLRGIVEDVGSESVGICLDTANSLGAGEGLATVLAELGPWTFNLHLKDFQVTRLPHAMGFRVEGRPAGEGLLDVPGLLEALAVHGRCETAVLELWTPPEAFLPETLAKEAAWVGRSLAYLKPWFPEPR
jgi:sugar phosphate isomerase/epimerase